MNNIIMKRAYEYYTYFNFRLSPENALKSIHIQLNNSCNLKCKWCSFVNPENKEFIKKELLVKIFDEIAQDERMNIKEINLWSAGEPLLHPDFVNIMKLIASYKKMYKRFPKVKLLTNATLLTKNMSKKIVEIGAIDYLGFSIDGGNKQEYGRLRAGGKFISVKKNIHEFLKLNNGKIETMVNCVVPIEKPLNTTWMSEDFKKILNSVDFYKLNYPDNNGGENMVQYPNNFAFIKTNKRICLALIQGLVIMPKGEVLFCCNDFNGSYSFSNLNKQSLFEICNSELRRDVIKKYFKKGKDAFYLCMTCNRFEMPYKIVKK